MSGTVTFLHVCVFGLFVSQSLGYVPSSRGLSYRLISSHRSSKTPENEQMKSFPKITLSNLLQLVMMGAGAPSLGEVVNISNFYCFDLS